MKRYASQVGRGSTASHVMHYAACMLAFFFAGCEIPQIPHRTIYEDPVNYVRLELDDSVLPEWPPGHHSHPKQFTVEQVTRILRGIMLKERRTWVQKWIQGEAQLVPVFKEEEIQLLAPQLAEAFAAAKHNERITFYLSQPQTSVKRVITSGGMYFQGDQLHVILGNWQFIYGIPTYGMIYDRRYPMRPTAAKGFDLFFHPSDAMILQRSSLWDVLLANEKDELVIDMSVLGQSPLAHLQPDISRSTVESHGVHLWPLMACRHSC